MLLPLLAYRAVHQLDTALRQSRSDDLLQRTHAAAALVNVSGLAQAMNYSLTGQPLDTQGVAEPGLVYAERLRYSIFLDGYADDWVSLKQPARGFVFDDGLRESQTALSSSLSSNDAKRRSPEQGDTSQRSARGSTDSNPEVTLRTAVSGSGLYLHIIVEDDRVVMHDPTLGLLSTGDHVELFWQTATDEPVRRVFRAVAPGLMQGHYYGPRFEGLQAVLIDSKTRGVFEITNTGYQMELRMPLPEPNSRFGIAVVDRDRPEDTIEPGQEYRKPLRWAGTFDPVALSASANGSDGMGGNLVYPSSELRRLMSDVVAAGSRLRVFDQGGRLRTDVNRLYEREAASQLIDPQKTHFFNAVLFRFFEWIIRKRQLAQDQPFTSEKIYLLDQQVRAAWQQADAGDSGTQNIRSYITLGRDHVIGAIEALGNSLAEDADEPELEQIGNQPAETLLPDGSPEKQVEAGPDRQNQATELDRQVPIGWILYETNEDNTNAFTSSAMVRVFSLVTAVSMLVALSLLAFATWLSFRIRRLSRAARSAVSADGKFVTAIKGSRSRDEIGDLSRDFASLVDRSRGYTQYLESLSAKLSHELRTPLSVVQTSLENIDQDNMAAGNKDLLVRARGGSEQLGRLLRSMSEAARLEQSIAAAEFQQIELAAWLKDLTAVYRDIYPQWEFDYRLPSQPVPARVVPELLLQALDKLVSNSTDFTATGNTIVLELSAQGSEAGFTVENPGSQLADEIRDTLFDPMVSSRATASGPGRQSGKGEKVPHLGLGLYIVRLVAECHHGKPNARNIDGGVKIGFSLKRDLAGRV